MAPPRNHARQLYADLGQLAESKATQIGPALAKVYNALLKEAHEGNPEDQVMSVLTPIGDGLHPRVAQALVGQLVMVLGGFGQ